MKEKNSKNLKKNRVFYEKSGTKGATFELYRLTYNNKRFLRKARQLREKLSIPAFIAGEELPQSFTENFLEMLELNLFLELACQKKVKTATVNDRHGRLCFKIDGAVKNLAVLKIQTENTVNYEDYSDYLLGTFGTCPLICSNSVHSGISYCLQTADGFLSFGAGGPRADISSIMCAEARKLCPMGVDNEQFFTLMAHFCHFPPLIKAKPTRLVLDEEVRDI